MEGVVGQLQRVATLHIHHVRTVRVDVMAVDAVVLPCPVTSLLSRLVLVLVVSQWRGGGPQRARHRIRGDPRFQAASCCDRYSGKIYNHLIEY